MDASQGQGGGPPPAHEQTSAILRQVLAALPQDTISVGAIMRRFRRRSFGAILILLAIVGLLPAISFLAGLAMIVPGVQMILGFRAPLLPRVLRRREVSTRHVRSIGLRIVPWIERLERLVRPRWLSRSQPPVSSAIGFAVIGLGLVVALPLPFSNLPPALALLFLAVGLLERDGVMVLVGLVLAVIALAIGLAVAFIAVGAVLLFLPKIAA